MNQDNKPADTEKTAVSVDIKDEAYIDAANKVRSVHRSLLGLEPALDLARQVDTRVQPLTAEERHAIALAQQALLGYQQRIFGGMR
jgi:hypothetical protein